MQENVWIKRTVKVVAASAVAFHLVQFQADQVQAATTQTTYTVQAGDYLYKIAQKEGVTVDQLKKWNNLSSDFLQIGDNLIINPIKGNTPTQPKPETTANTYDTLDKAIAAAKAGFDWRKYDNWRVDWVQGKYVVTYIPLNNQRPTHPKPTPMTGTYTVQAGDSYWKIANRIGVTIANLQKWNNRTNYNLYPGEKFIVKAPTTQPVNPKPSPTTKTYTVQAGDTYWKIANKFGVSIENLMKWNNRKDYFLQIGEKIKVQNQTTQPTQPTQPDQTQRIAYTVQAGDSYWRIADRYGVTVEQLMRWNNAKSNFLQVGDKVIIHR